MMSGLPTMELTLLMMSEEPITSAPPIESDSPMMSASPILFVLQFIIYKTVYRQQPSSY